MEAVIILQRVGWEAWSSGLGRRLVFRRLWVRILAPDTGWTFFALVCQDKINEKEVRVGPFKNIILQRTIPIRDYFTAQLFLKFSSLDSTASVYSIVYVVIQITTYFLFWLNPILLNCRPAVEEFLPQQWVFSVIIHLT